MCIYIYIHKCIQSCRYTLCNCMWICEYTCLCMWTFLCRQYVQVPVHIFRCIRTEIIFISIWAYVYIIFCMWSAVCLCNWLLITWVGAYDHIIDLFHMLICSVWYWICRNAWNCSVSLRPNVSVAVLKTCVCVCSWLEHPIQIPDPIAAGIWSVAWWKITISYAGPPVELNSPFRLPVEEKLWHLVLVVPSNWFPYSVLPFDSV
jgi:hypothetical protein